MSEKKEIPNSSRKLFFGLFVFPLIITVCMAIMLCAVVLLTHEKETPETLIASIKKSSPSKRWQKAFELSNELNRKHKDPSAALWLKPMIEILNDTQYDPKTRGYIALALSHFDDPVAAAALADILDSSDDDLKIYVLWSLGNLGATNAAPKIIPLLKSRNADLRKTAVYVLGALGDRAVAASLRELLSDPIADVRWNTALALARLGDDAGSGILMQMLQRETLFNDREMDEASAESIMINAAKGLTLIHKPEAIKILQSVSQNDRSLKVRQAAMDALEYQKKQLST